MNRHCERSEAIHHTAWTAWIASTLSLLAMTTKSVIESESLRFSELLRELLRAHIEVLDQQLAVMRRHLAVMLPGHGIGRTFCALLEHFGLLPEYRRFGHDLLLFGET
jgi:hypothetical protein